MQNLRILNVSAGNTSYGHADIPFSAINNYLWTNFQTMESATLEFLRRLRLNNNREWFNTHKNLYTAAREDVIRLIESVTEACAPFDPEIAKTDARKSLFRIYRDIRFSPNKDPYKTNFGASLGTGKGSQTAGYYLHIEPGKSFAGGGLYMPETAALKKVRQEISVFGKDFLSIIHNANFRQYFDGLDEENSLRRIPQGFEKEDPMGEYLKLKSFVVFHSLPDEEITADDAPENIARMFRALQPLNTFINTALT